MGEISPRLSFSQGTRETIYLPRVEFAIKQLSLLGHILNVTSLVCRTYRGHGCTGYAVKSRVCKPGQKSVEIKEGTSRLRTCQVHHIGGLVGGPRNLHDSRHSPQFPRLSRADLTDPIPGSYRSAST